MSTAGIIAEYNPFHLGHAYHAARTKAPGHAVAAVMSGHFVQRGDVSVFTKWARAKAAVLCGVDLVVELPLPWAMAPAETFARGAVGVLAALGCVDTLSFGSESGDLAAVTAASIAAGAQPVQARMKELLAGGVTFAKAREAAVRELHSPAAADALRRPNDTLAAEYLRALRRFAPDIAPMAVRRAGQAHDENGGTPGFGPGGSGPDDPGGSILCASAVRGLYRDGRDASAHLPDAARRVFEDEVAAGRGPVFLESLDGVLLSRLRMLPGSAFSALPDLSEGLENRLLKAVGAGRSFPEICAAAKTKRYTLARLRRLLLCAALGVRAADTRGVPPYIRVLAFGEGGREILRAARKSASLPVIMRAADVSGLNRRGRRIYALECAATDLYSLAFSPPGRCGLEMLSSARPCP